MAPNRVRATEDSRSESSVAAAKQPNVSMSHKQSKGKRADWSMTTVMTSSRSLLKEVTSAADEGTNPVATGESTHSGVNWSTVPVSCLNAYRHAHRLEVPTAFSDYVSQTRLMHPKGVGAYSPTMAQSKIRRRVPKEQLARAVRKDFNAAAVNETEVVTSFLYAVGNQDKHFRMRFRPDEGQGSKKAG